MMFQSLFLTICEGRAQANLYSPFTKEYSEHTCEILILIERIKLRLNPDKDSDLIDFLSELEDIISVHKDIQSARLVDDVIKKLFNSSHRVFKTEWERVQNGELWFYWSKWIAIGISVRFRSYICIKSFEATYVH